MRKRRKQEARAYLNMSSINMQIDGPIIKRNGKHTKTSSICVTVPMCVSVSVHLGQQKWQDRVPGSKKPLREESVMAVKDNWVR